MVEDVRQFVRINLLVLQAQQAGFTLRREDGEPFRYCPITVIRPSVPQGDTLDFSREAITRRLNAGRDAATAWLATSMETASGSPTH
jgi:NTE family protein